MGIPIAPFRWAYRPRRENASRVRAPIISPARPARGPGPPATACQRGSRAHPHRPLPCLAQAASQLPASPVLPRYRPRDRRAVGYRGRPRPHLPPRAGPAKPQDQAGQRLPSPAARRRAVPALAQSLSRNGSARPQRSIAAAVSHLDDHARSQRASTHRCRIADSARAGGRGY